MIALHERAEAPQIVLATEKAGKGDQPLCARRMYKLISTIRRGRNKKSAAFGAYPASLEKNPSRHDRHQTL